MKHLILIISFVLLAVTPLASRAQDAAPPWPPDPKTIFADGVEVVDATPTFNNESRTIYVYRNGWRSFSYPDEITNINDGYFAPYLIAGEAVLISADERTNGDPFNWVVWSLNLDTGKFSRFPLLCGQQPNYLIWKQAEGSLEWTYSVSSDGTYRLCNTLTGQMSPPLPNWTDWWGGDLGSGLVDYSYQPSVSPDGKRIIFFGYNVDGSTSGGIGGLPGTIVASYETGTDRFRNLGTGGGHDSAYVVKWLNDKKAIIYTGDMPSDYWRGYHLVDAAKSKSLETIVGGDGWESGPDYIDNPPHFEELRVPVDEMVRWPGYNYERGPCRLTIFNVNPLEEKEYLFGDNCVQFFKTESGVIIYRTIPVQEPTRSILFRVNKLGEKGFQVLSGEIESIVSISPGGNYALILSDNNGRIDEELEGYAYGPKWATMKAPSLDIYDLNSGKVIFHIEASPEELLLNKKPLWIEDSILLLQLPQDSPYTKWLIRLAQGVAHETIINKVIDSDNPSERRFLILNDHILDTDLTGPLSVYDVETDSITQIVKAYNTHLYHIGISGSSENLAHVWISGFESKTNTYALTVTYTIRVPQSQG